MLSAGSSLPRNPAGQQADAGERGAPGADAVDALSPPAAALRLLSIRCIQLLQQFQGLDAQQHQEDSMGHQELAALAYQYRRRKAGILQGFVQSQSLLHLLACTE